VTWYREIDVVQEPFDLGLDANGRAVVAFNVRAIKGPSATFEQELVARLVAAGVGSAGSTIFVSSSAAIPDGDGPYLTVTATGGLAPERTQAELPAYQRPSAQIAVRARTYAAARDRARAAYQALVGVRNVDLPAA